MGFFRVILEDFFFLSRSEDLGRVADFSLPLWDEDPDCPLPLWVVSEVDLVEVDLLGVDSLVGVDFLEGVDFLVGDVLLEADDFLVGVDLVAPAVDLSACLRELVPDVEGGGTSSSSERRPSSGSSCPDNGNPRRRVTRAN